MTTSPIRPYDDANDLDSILRIWNEVGWLDDDSKRDSLGAFLRSANAEVGVVDGTPECMVHWTPGSIEHTRTRLGVCAITAVTTSLIGRKRGFASTMTARALRQGAEAGLAVSALGMFEQGFYDRLGFGTAADSVIFQFDPTRLDIDAPSRPVCRLGAEHAGEMYAALLDRQTAHGSVTIESRGVFEAEIAFATKPLGLGYRDDAGRLTHFVFGRLEGEHGPFDVQHIAYRSADDLRELFGLFREVGDQIRSVKMLEPPHAQIQSLLREPLRDRMRTRASAHETGGRAIAWWQLRMLDVVACVAAYEWHGEPVEFNLVLDDPLGERLDGDGWRGVGGEYTISVGAPSQAVPGHRTGLPSLRASVNSFSRLWFGVRPVHALVATDRIDAPAGLIESLDRAVRVPVPHPHWEF